MIDRHLANFLEQGLSIHIGTRDERMHPAGGRAVAVSVEADGQHLVVFVADAAARRLLNDLESNGQATVGFGRPEDERACQVKGVVVDIRPARAEEQALVERQWHGFLHQFQMIGIPSAITDGWATWPAVAIRLRVTSVFEQTPGPQAGEAIQ